MRKFLASVIFVAMFCLLCGCCNGGSDIHDTMSDIGESMTVHAVTEAKIEPWSLEAVTDMSGNFDDEVVTVPG